MVNGLQHSQRDIGAVEANVGLFQGIEVQFGTIPGDPLRSNACFKIETDSTSEMNLHRDGTFGILDSMRKT